MINPVPQTVAVSRPTCLLVVDVQVQFRTPETAPAYDRIPDVLARFDYVVASRSVPAAGGIVDRFKRWQPAAPDSAEAAYWVDFSGRSPERTLLIDKIDYNAFNDRVRAWVEARGVREVYLCGSDTDMCLLRSALGVMEAGLRPIIITSLCASTGGPELHHFGLIQMKRLLGRDQLVASV
jgi:nicotinamidase-related amidase